MNGMMNDEFRVGIRDFEDENDGPTNISDTPLEVQAEGDHLGADKSGAFVEAHGSEVGDVRQQRDTGATGGARTGDGSVEQLLADALAAPGGMNDHVFHPRSKTALGGADGEENADHGDNVAAIGGAIEMADGGIFEDAPEGAGLFIAIGREVGFLREEQRQQIAERGKIGGGGAADVHLAGRI